MKKWKLNRPLRLKKQEAPPPSDWFDALLDRRFWQALGMKSVVLFLPLAVVGVGGIVAISVAPLLVLGVLLLGFAVYGVLQKEWSRVIRLACGTVAAFGLSLAVYSAIHDGDALVSRLKLVVDKVRPGPSKAVLERERELNKEEDSRRKKEYDVFKKMIEIRKRYSNLPADYPKLLEEAHALAELAKEFGRDSGPKFWVLMQYEEIKNTAYYHHTEFGHLPIYKKIYGTNEAPK